MKDLYFNANIVGGGLIGSITAYTLSRIGFTVSIVEKKSPFNNNYYNDYRTTAISEGTKNFLENIYLWNEIKSFCEPIKKIRVIDRRLSNKLEFDNKRRNSNLGYIIKNKDLLNVVYKKLKTSNNVKIINNFKIDNFEINNDTIKTISSKLKILSDINIAADGKNSYVKKFFKTNSYFKEYNKSALVITLTHTENHNNTAFEFFYKNGPLAILPMQSKSGKFYSSIIWTNNNKYLNDISNLDDNRLKEILNENTQFCIGNIKKIISKQIFPLTAHINSRFFDKRTIYIGDAAHSFHPIAGQGWNLGISDIHNLYRIANEQKKLGIELGGELFCKKYNNENYYRAYRLYQITDKLDYVFQNQNKLIKLGRSSGLSLINKSRKLKNMISDFAMNVN